MSVESEKLAIHRLALRGYLFQHGGVWYIVNDDPDQGLEKNWVGDWPDNAEDLYQTLRELEFPTRDLDVRCLECKEVETYLGDLCPACSKLAVLETRGESQREMRVGK